MSFRLVLGRRCRLMQTSIFVLCVFLTSGFSSAFRARKAETLDVDFIRHYFSEDGRAFIQEGNETAAFPFNPNEDLATVRTFLVNSLKPHEAEMIIVPGDKFKDGEQVDLGSDVLEGTALRNEAVNLLHAQNAMSGLPDGQDYLHKGLQKASQVVLVLVRDAENVWKVKALAAMKNTEIAPDGKFCEAGYIVVDPAIQGRRVGSTLWRGLRVVAKQMEVEAFFTETLVSNVASLKLQRHNCVEVILLGLFTEKAACSKYPDRADLQLLVMLFPLTTDFPHRIRLMGIAASVRSMYQKMLTNGSIATWVENEPTDALASPEFLNYHQVLEAVHEDPTVDEYFKYGVSKGKAAFNKPVDHWKSDFAVNLCRELGVWVPPVAERQRVKPTGDGSSQIQLRLKPTPLRESSATIWNNKVVMIGLGILILMNCVLLMSAVYFRIYPRDDSDDTAEDAKDPAKKTPEVDKCSD